ncbi:MAG: ABC transporter ATP-binding protein [Rhodospirillaceae bacterium]
MSAAAPQLESKAEQPIQGGPSTLRAEDIGVRFQSLAALTDINLTLQRGEIFGLIGPNGAGKTTLVNCLTGFQRSSSGRVVLGERDTAGWGPDHFRKAGIARTFQAGRLFKDMSVIENVEVAGVGMGLSRREARRHGLALLTWLGIADKAEQTAGSLPYTDERRVGIARALMLSPAFVLMDEPAAGMSDAECEDLMGLVSSMPALYGCGVLLIEHNMSVVMAVCARVHVLDGGRSVAEGTCQEIQNNPAVIGAYLGMEA